MNCSLPKVPACLGKALVTLVNSRPQVGVICTCVSSENRALRRIIGSKEENITGDRGTLYNVELHDLYSLWYVIQAIKSRQMRWVRVCVTYGEEEESILYFSRKT
jgi:hypothetical protein